jgi:hypothetical protein
MATNPTLPISPFHVMATNPILMTSQYIAQRASPVTTQNVEFQKHTEVKQTSSRNFPTIFEGEKNKTKKKKLKILIK